ncbi:MAG: fimbria/pilus outer membrane usher protein [Hyphomonadaceae bacterium]
MRAAADTAPQPFVAQFSLPARGLAVEAIAARQGDEIYVDRAVLIALSIAPPPAFDEARAPLSAVPGLTYTEDRAGARVRITCAASCFALQRIDPQQEAPRAERPPWGGYLNYDANLEWLSADGQTLSALLQGAVFGPLGLLENGAAAQSGTHGGMVRLESRWTFDWQDARVRLRLGDSSAAGAGGGAFRFGGVQIGRDFGLTPAFLPYPLPTLLGEAGARSTMDLYVDGALRARTHAEAGPFALENAPLTAGAGVAQVVVKDVLGREAIIGRPFFVSTRLLRRGLSDFSAAVGAVRRNYGDESFDYGKAFAAGRYSIGVTDAVTAEAAIELAGDARNAQAGVTLASLLGEFSLRRSESERAGRSGSISAAAWRRDSPRWSAGLEYQGRRGATAFLGEPMAEGNGVRAIGDVGFNAGAYGAFSWTAAMIEAPGAPRVQTLAMAYTPAIAKGGFQVRLLYTQDTRSELLFGLSFSTLLRGGVSANAGFSRERGRERLSISAQKPIDAGEGWGWRADVEAGDKARVRVAASRLGRAGAFDTELSRTDSAAGVRARYAGSVGWIGPRAFAARPIEGAFALVDAGAAHVRVRRDGMPAGRTGPDGRLLVTGLRPYEANRVTLSLDDMPLGRAVTRDTITAVPAEAAGALIRFAPYQSAMRAMRAVYADGAALARGEILVRTRDGGRFPVGADGRIVVMGAADGDTFHVDAARECVGAPAPQARIVFSCAAAS